MDAHTLFALKVSWQLGRLLETSESKSQALPTRFVLVPSTRDAVGELVYPQPPLAQADCAVELAARAKKPTPSWDEELPVGSLELPGLDAGRVLCVGNPGCFCVNELVVAVTATDVLMHLSADELYEKRAKPSLGEEKELPRVARLASHLLQQRSFYPLHPPPPSSFVGGGAPLDLRQHARWRLPLKPDLLICPSLLQPFALDVDGTLVLNPGLLAKNTSGGSYARLSVHPLTRTDDQQRAQDPLAHAAPQRTRVDILRI